MNDKKKILKKNKQILNCRTDKQTPVEIFFKAANRLVFFYVHKRLYILLFCFFSQTNIFKVLFLILILFCSNKITSFVAILIRINFIQNATKKNTPTTSPLPPPTTTNRKKNWTKKRKFFVCNCKNYSKLFKQKRNKCNQNRFWQVV